MLCSSSTLRSVLEKDLTETLHRLRMARISRDRPEIAALGKRLDWLLDRFSLLVRESGERK